ncbi:MAG: hypothetical protein ACRDCB_10295 [Clostridium sp.]|uniref:hypothetical protein n=1 Tax=Clostridium chrysemydis TaxID=2665504 RepID=UPI003EE69EE7
MKEKIKSILKTSKGKIILAVIIGIALGGMFGGATSEQVEAVDKVKVLEKENKELKDQLDKAKPFLEMQEAKQKEELEKAKKEAEEKERKEEEEKAKKEREEKAKKEAEEKKGYNTGITYDNLARTPDKYKDKKVKFTGKVIQVMEGDGYTQMRLAVNSDYDKIILIEIDSGSTDSRILEDDVITIMGTSNGLISYDSTMGGKITIPAVIVDKVEQ